MTDPSADLTVRRYGETSVLVDVAPGAAAGVAIRSRRVFGTLLLDAVPAHRSVLLEFRSAVPPGRVLELLSQQPPDRPGSADADLSSLPADTVTIPVAYEGPDLDYVATATGLTPAEVIALHTGAEFRVEFFGFAPGFAYLVGLPPALRLPRRDTPRTSVPSGSVAIAAEYSAVYPRSSPGGWHLLGRTDMTMFDAAAMPPSPLTPGGLVRFVAVPGR